ncbi:MAG TPA: acireductone dioxygenase [Magnetospirillaceae bacterium]|jgi:1,2-dihydroxy-3-keto-5-methylthiopentene dioxygenase
MSRLAIHPSSSSAAPTLVTSDGARIAQELEKVGVRFERWEATAKLAASAGQDEVLAAYAKDVERLRQIGGYKSQDVVRMHPDHPDREAARAKFLAEHIHEDDEVRFFVEGSGTFFLHIGDTVYEILCEKDDLLSVPAGTKHWFDMGERPLFAAIRIFISPDGWVAKFTGDTIATRFVHEAA